MVLGTMDLSSSISTKNTQPNNNHNPTKTFTNGGSSLKQPPSMVAGGVTTYRECLKNHAASIGGHALDGCGEFMPSPAAVSADPSSLKCAACGCHRNFHRRDNPEEQKHPNKPRHHHFHLHHSPPFPPATAPAPPHRNSSPSPSLSPGRSSSPGPTPSPTPSPHSPPPVSHLPPNSYFASPAPPPAQMLLALSAGKAGGFAPPCDDLGRSVNRTVMRSSVENSQARKRFRTKFSQEQKDKMCLFAEKLDWKMQRSEEKMVEEFCNEIGIRKGVLKVWMHNNKHTIGKRERGLVNGVNNFNGDNMVSGFGNSRADNHEDDDDDDDIGNDADDNDKDEDRKSNLNFFANGSSSSS